MKNLPVPVGPQRLAIEYQDPKALKPNPKNARKHSPAQIVAIGRAITEFGWSAPVLVSPDLDIIAGHARVLAALKLKMKVVPCIRLPHLTEAQTKALAIADNKLGDLSHFDPAALADALSELVGFDYDVDLTGFVVAEVDALLSLSEPTGDDPVDTFDAPQDVASVSRPGDLWQVGRHRLLCGDARDEANFLRLLGETRADMVFADPPYNVPIAKHVSGLGRVKHGEFAMACGEMSRADYVAFLRTVMERLASFSKDGSLHYICMDWRHNRELQEAGDPVYSELKTLVVWSKTNGGMGSFYRSQHELVFVYKAGTAPHLNNINLGRHGRNRTNVWTYPGANGFGATRMEDLADHPTVKPVALVADAIRDCTPRKGLVLDPFAGSGVTLLAAERTGRTAAAIEIEPAFVDVAIRRWQKLTKKAATLVENGRTFDEIAVSGRDEEKLA